jgi:hypothetical protein
MISALLSFFVLILVLFAIALITFAIVEFQEIRRLRAKRDLLCERIASENRMPKPAYDLQGRRIS